MMNPTIFFLIGTLITRGSEAVKITSVKIPAAIENGTTSVILDCDYLIPCEEQSGLVVHWFWNKHPEPVYQWIPNKPPQGLGPLRGRINLQYRASEDPCRSHRAMQILNPSPDLSGEYRCKISTWDGEDTAAANMIVYVREESLTVSHSRIAGSNKVNVTCHVGGIFPEPKVELVLQNGSRGDRKPLHGVTVSSSKRDGLYDATAYKVVEERQLYGVDGIDCVVKLAGTQYESSRQMMYNAGSVGVSGDGGVAGVGLWSLSTSAPSMSAPHQQRTTDHLWQSTGRGIRAHESHIDSGSSAGRSSFVLLLLCAWSIVAASGCQLPVLIFNKLLLE